jgi:excisionase family DNA binding protein
MTDPSRLSRFLTLKDVATSLGVSIKSLRRWIDAGELRVHRLGRQLRVSEEDLNSFLGQRRK